MATVKRMKKQSSASKMKKYQGGGTMDPRVAEFLKKRGASDTTKMYNRAEMLQTINDITAGKIKPRVDKPMASGKSKPTTYSVVSGKDTTYMDKADFERRFGNKKKSGGKVAKKAVKSVKAVKKVVKAVKKK
jgi:hypothetical protein